jgi:hypothetical protein
MITDALKFLFIVLFGLLLLIIIILGAYNLTRWISFQSANEACINSYPVGASCKCIEGSWTVNCFKEATMFTPRSESKCWINEKEVDCNMSLIHSLREDKG